MMMASHQNDGDEDTNRESNNKERSHPISYRYVRLVRSLSYLAMKKQAYETKQMDQAPSVVRLTASSPDPHDGLTPSLTPGRRLRIRGRTRGKKVLAMVSAFSIMSIVCGHFVDGFQPRPRAYYSSFPKDLQRPPATPSSSSSSTSLFGRSRRGGRGKQFGDELKELLVDDERGATISKTKQRTRKTAPKKRTAIASASKTSAGGVSPALAQWAASQSDVSARGAEGDMPSPVSTTAPPADASTFVTFDDEEEDEEDLASPPKRSNKKSNNKRRVKQSERIASEQAWNNQLEALVDELDDVLEDEEGNARKSPDIDDILSPLRKMIALSSSSPTGTSLKTLTASTGKKNSKSTNKNPRGGYDYRLAWVGSDEAICHVGTSLHKVPLARLQEVFLSLPGRNRVQWQEVIRVIGPFPNVRNNLEGQCQSKRIAISSTTDMDDMTITWESMIDGAGKELMAGKDEDTRTVKLQVYVASPNVLVAVVPPEDDDDKWRTDPLEDNGKHVLVFVREDDLNENLERLRVV